MAYTPITALPTVPTRSQPQATFTTTADAFLTALPVFRTEVNNAGSYFDATAATTAASALAASGSATTATTQAGNASTSAVAALVSQNAAAVSAASAVGGASTNSTSTDARVPNTQYLAGTVSITVQTGKDYVPGCWVSIAYTTDPTEYMVGVVITYNTGTGAMVVAVLRANGLVSRSAWTISKCGPVVKTPFSETILALFGTAIVLPDLTSYLIAPHVIAPGNAVSPSTVTLTTSDGWSIAPGLTANTLVAPFSIATAHGAWGSKAMTPPLLSTIAGSSTNTVLATVQLDTNLVVVLARDGSAVTVTAFNTTTGAKGATSTIVASAPVGVSHALFKESTTSCTAFVGVSSDTTIRAFSVNAGTLAITMGTAVTTGVAVSNTPTRLTTGVYIFGQVTANDIRVATVSGTTVTLGTAVASGAVSTVAGNLLIARSSNTEAMIVYTTTGGGAAGTRGLTARIVSVAGTVPTLNTVSNAATNVMNTSGLRVLLSPTEGTSYIVVGQDGAVGTTSNFYGLSASGTTATLGTITARATDLPIFYTPGTFIQAPGGLGVINYGGSDALFGHLTAGPYQVGISGTTLTFGATLGLSSGATTFVLDAATSSNYYALGTATNWLTSPGAPVNSQEQLLYATTLVASATVMDKSVKYGSTWYPWTMVSTPAALVSPTMWLFDNGNNFELRGPIA